jgi:tetratricopeptide (TPR) repeat protein
MLRFYLTLLVFTGSLALAPTAASAQTADYDCDVDEQTVLIKYSLYFENFRAENYEAALPDLEWMLACAPGFAGRTQDARNFRRAVELHEALAERATDPSEGKRHLERALQLIETAVPTLVDAGADVSEHEWLIRKGRFIQTHENVFPSRIHEAWAAYEAAFALDAEATDDFYLQVIAFARAEQALAEDTPEAKRDVREFLEETLLAHAEDATVRDYIQTQADRLITTGREQFAFLYERYTQVGATGLTEDELDQLFTLNQQAGEQFFDNGVQSQALRRELLPHIVNMNPTFGRLTTLANVYVSEGDPDQATLLFERALEIAENSNQRRDTYYNIAAMKQQQGQRASAANYVREALAIDANHGQSLFLMGSLIQTSVRGNDIDSRAAYWCAADFFSRAASQGVSNARAAAASALRAAPSSEDYFFKGWRPGQTVTASYGWGSCQARVR